MVNVGEKIMYMLAMTKISLSGLLYIRHIIVSQYIFPQSYMHNNWCH